MEKIARFPGGEEALSPVTSLAVMVFVGPEYQRDQNYYKKSFSKRDPRSHYSCDHHKSTLHLVRKRAQKDHKKKRFQGIIL